VLLLNECLLLLFISLSTQPGKFYIHPHTLFIYHYNTHFTLTIYTDESRQVYHIYHDISNMKPCELCIINCLNCNCARKEEYDQYVPHSQDHVVQFSTHTRGFPCSSQSIITVGNRLFCYMIPSRGREWSFSLCHHIQTGSGVHPASCLMGNWGYGTLKSKTLGLTGERK
jgi:hypothetical protein